MRSLQRRDDTGSSTIELVIATPILIGLLLLIVGLGRYGTARGQVDSASREAARAASLERTAPKAKAAGQAAAAALLAAENITCSSFNVTVSTVAFKPGGSVAATVKCTATLSGLGLSGLPGTKMFEATSVAPIENYRSG